MEPPADLLGDVEETHEVHAMSQSCLMACGKDHLPCECPNINGDVEKQKKIFASLRRPRQSVSIRQCTVADATEDDDLIDLGGDDSGMDFRQGELCMLCSVLAQLATRARMLVAETRIKLF